MTPAQLTIGEQVKVDEIVGPCIVGGIYETIEVGAIDGETIVWLLCETNRRYDYAIYVYDYVRHLYSLRLADNDGFPLTTEITSITK